MPVTATSRMHATATPEPERDIAEGSGARRDSARSRMRRVPALAAAALALTVALAAQLTGMLTGLEQQTMNARFAVRGTQRPNDVVVVGIDDRTFSDLRRQWPFPRSLHGNVVARLHADGARQILYDVQFTEPTTRDQDMALYDAIGRGGGAVLATTESDGHGHTNVLGGDANLASIGSRAAAANLTNDASGIITRFPYAVAGLRSMAVVEAERTTGRRLSRALFPSGGALIDYRGGPGTIPTVSFSQVRAGSVPASFFRGKVVVVGAVRPALGDIHATPVGGSALMSGPEVQANAVWTALHGVPLRSAPGWLMLALVGVMGVFAPLLRRRVGVIATGAGAALLGAAFAVAAQIAFDAGLALSVIAPLLALLVGAVATIVASHWAESRERRRAARENDVLEARVRERTAELRDAHLEMIHRLAQAAESRDEDTGQHIERIGALCDRLARALELPEEEIEMLRVASAMHDVGKIGIPDRVLLKEGPLDKSEWETMKGHATIGAEILSHSSSSLIQMAETIARTHHERWDGSGYPAGLKGEEIPLVGRICAVCDVFDALMSERPYKPAWQLPNAIAEIRRVSGSHLDARLVDVFLTLIPELVDGGLTGAYPSGPHAGDGEALQSSDGPARDQEHEPTAGPPPAEGDALPPADRQLSPA